MTIGFIDSTAGWTSPGSVSRVNQSQRHTRQFGFVLDKTTQLIKRPTMQLTSLRLPSPYPAAYPAQVFQSEAASGAFGLVHELLGNAVVYISCKASLLARHSLKTTTCRFRSFGLKSGADPVVTTAEALNVAAGIELTVRIDGDINKAHVNAKMPFHVNRFGRFYVTSCQHVPFSAHIAQVGLAAPELEQFQVARSGDEGDSHAAVERPERDSSAVEVVRQNPVVIGECAPLGEAAPGVLADIISVRNPADGANNHLRRQPEPRPNIVVGQLVKRELPEGLGRPRLFGDVITRGVSTLQRLSQAISLLRGGEEFNPRSQLHNMNISTDFLFNQAVARCAPPVFLSPLNEGGVLRRFL